MLREDEIKKQRKIGKQLMLVNLFNCEKDSVVPVSIDDAAAWASMDINDVRKLSNFWRGFSSYELSWGAVHAYERGEEYAGRNANLFLFRTCMVYGSLSLEILICNLEKKFVDYLAHENYTEYCKKHSTRPIRDEMNQSGVFEKILRYYEDQFIEVLEDAIAEGYDWDVICELAGFSISTKKYARYYESCLEKSKVSEA
ncbi:MAG: hypothetical protein E7300_03085 [Lachnospiraceae bacterium]|nr:hypothetical protein [Lachnospiraceae bacterium]